MYCGVSMQPMPGIPRHKRLQFHILRRCAKYRTQSGTTLTARPAMPPPAKPTSTARPPTARPSRPTPASSEPASRKPRPVVCKKRAGDSFKKHFLH